MASSTSFCTASNSSFFSFSSLFNKNEVANAPAPNVKNDNLGSPGRNPKTNKTAPVIPIVTGADVNCLPKRLPKFFSLLDFVTSIPADTDINNADIWLTRPSPIVSLIKFCTASPKLIFIITTPIIIPPITFIIVTIIPAIASPFTNLDAPSIAP